jgi:hypothetical protein
MKKGKSAPKAEKQIRGTQRRAIGEATLNANWAKTSS